MPIEATSGGAVPLVLIHGLSASPRVWAPVVPLLAAEREVHTVVLPGHRDGGSLPPEVPFTSQSYVDAVVEQLDRLGIASADLVGNSLGGWIALQLAGRGRARSVVCLAPVGGWHPGGVFDRRLAIQFAAAYHACRLLDTRWGRRVMHASGVRRALLRALVARPDLVSREAYVDTVLDVARCPAVPYSVHRPTARDVHEAPRLDCPVLLAWSERDRILVSGRYRERLARQIGTPSVTWLPRVGHVPMSDDPALVAATILDFTGKGARVARSAG